MSTDNFYDYCQSNNLDWLYDEFDYESNLSIGFPRPDFASSSDIRKVYWICNKCSIKFLKSISERLKYPNCPNCSPSDSSSQEQLVRYYLSKYFHVLHTRDILPSKKELDIYIPELKVAVEYDGVCWHQDIQKDKDKDLECANLGITLYRIREKGCPKLDSSSICIFRDSTHTASLEFCIEELLRQLGILHKVSFVEDKGSFANFCKVPDEDNSFGSRFPEEAKDWDYSKNGDATPYNTSYAKSENFNFKCHKCGRTYHPRLDDVVRDRYNIRRVECPNCGWGSSNASNEDVWRREVARRFAEEIKGLDNKFREANPTQDDIKRIELDMLGEGLTLENIKRCRHLKGIKKEMYKLLNETKVAL